MAIGFPAYHQKKQNIEAGAKQIEESIKATFEQLGWQITGQNGNRIIGKTLSGTLTHGERVIVEIIDNQFGIRSECFIPTQFLDFGKNRKNIETFLATFEKLA